MRLNRNRLAKLVAGGTGVVLGATIGAIQRGQSLHDLAAWIVGTWLLLAALSLILSTRRS